MVFKPNYNMQRAERNRAKQAKKDEKLRDKEEAASRRKAELDASGAPSDSPIPSEASLDTPAEDTSAKLASTGGSNGA